MRVLRVTLESRLIRKTRTTSFAFEFRHIAFTNVEGREHGNSEFP